MHPYYFHVLRILKNEIEYPQTVSTMLTPEIVQLAFETSQATIAVLALAEKVQIVVGDAGSGLGLAIVAQLARCLPQSQSENLVVLSQ